MISLKLLHLLLQLFYSSLFISGKTFFVIFKAWYSICTRPPPQLPQKTTTILLQLPVFEKMTNWWLITSHWILTNVTCHIFLTTMGQMVGMVVGSENCSPLSHKPRWCHARQTRQDLRSIFNQSVQVLKQMCTQAAILSAMHIRSKSGTQIIKKKVTHEHIRLRTERAIVWDINVHLFVQTSLPDIF